MPGRLWATSKAQQEAKPLEIGLARILPAEGFGGRAGGQFLLL